MENLVKCCEVTKEVLANVVNNIAYNKIIIEYYQRLAGELEGGAKEIINRKIENIQCCNKFWDLDKYKIQKIKDFKRTNLCKDKFCNNCKKVKQSSRMARYMPELQNYSNISYHLTLTAPSVTGEELENRIKVMAEAFRKLIGYLSGRKKIRGIDFLKWGYKGAIRSLEITFKGDMFHPHFHCLLILDGFQMSDKIITNTYSYSYGEFKTGFSKEEILIQKIWYLLMNGESVNKKNIDSLDIGYSCKLDKLEPNDYNEVFKYMTKETQEDGQVLTYEQFKALYFSLYRVKQIQGYGVLFHVSDEGDIESYMEEYEKIIESLKLVEMPDRVLEKPEELLNDKDYLLISRKSYFKYLRELSK